MRKAIVVLSVLAFLLVPALATAATTVEGTIQGLKCVTEGKVCPVGEEDILASLEDHFVLLAKDGKKWYLLPNVARNQLARYINVPVKATGDMNAAGNAITVKTMEAMKDGKWMTVYSPELVEKFRDKMEWKY